MLLLGSIPACTADANREAHYTPPIHRDSGGIAIVENAMPSWRATATVRISSPPEVVIGSVDVPSPTGDDGEGASTYIALHRVLDIRVLSGARIVVADAGLNQVMVFDSAGGLAHRFVRRGEGPGEMNVIVRLEVCGGDSIVVADRFKAAVFNVDGSFGRHVNYRSAGEFRSLVGVSADCGRLLTVRTVQAPPAGTWGMAEDRFSWIEPDAQSADSVMTVAVREVWTRQLYGAERPFVVPWGTSRTYVVAQDVIVAGHGRVPELRRYDTSGDLISLIRWSDEVRPLTRVERGRYDDVRREWLSAMPDDPESEFLFPALDEYPHLPTTLPLFDGILMADDGSVWVRRFPENSFGVFDARLHDRETLPQEWIVFDSQGTWLGEFTFPERFDLKAVSGSRLVGVSKDENNTETVHVLRMPSTH